VITAIYCRVSTSDQREEGTSLDTQRDQGLRKARELGWTAPLEYIILEDWTGKNLERPGLLRLFDWARAKKIQAVIIYTLDRLYRPENDGDEWRVFQVLQQLQAIGVQVVWVDSSMPSDGPFSGLLTFLNTWKAGQERRDMLRRTSEGRLKKAQQGKVVSRAASCFGYRFDPSISTLVVHEEEAKVVRLMFHLYLQDRLSLVELADRLNRLGIKTPRRGQRWHSSALGLMLRNETYTGTLWQHRWRKLERNGKVTYEERPTEEWIATPVPVIVPNEVFDQVQRRLAENWRHARRNTRREYLLSGLLKHSCGSRMGGRFSKGSVYYHCYKRQHFKAPIDEKGEPQSCRSGWVSGRRLETAVWDTVTNLLKHPTLLMQELERLAEPTSATREALEEELAVVRERLKELPKEERRVVEGYRKGFYPDFMMREEMERVNKEKVAAEERRQEVERELGRLERAAAYKGQVQALAKRLSKGLDSMGFHERRELLRLLVDEVVYDSGQVTIKTIIPLDERRLHPEAEGVHGGWQGEVDEGHGAGCHTGGDRAP